MITKTMMQKFSVISFIFLLIFLPCSANAANILNNPDFDNGNTSGWYNFGTAVLTASTAQAHSGSYSALVTNRTETWNGIAQSLLGKINDKDTCNISGWVMLENESSENIKITIVQKDDNGTKYINIGTSASSSTAWTNISGAFTLNVTGTLTGLTLYVELPPAGVNFYVDDVSVTVTSSGDWKTEANQRIEQIRKGNFTITATVPNQGQLPAPNVDIQIIQTRHHFPFGSAISKSSITDTDYLNFFKDHFDWAVMENASKWYANEPSEDYVTYADADNIYNFCNANNITMRGHCISWAAENMVQDWIKNLTYAPLPDTSPLRLVLEDRLNSTVNHFKGKFVHWDVNNEMCNNSFYRDRLGEDIVPWMFNAANATDPDCKLFLNDYNVISGGYNLNSFKQMALDLTNQGTPLHALGVQCHMKSTFNPSTIKARFDSIAELNLPIWITEFDVEEPDEKIRADKLEEFYRIAFSHPSVEGILMWGFWEDRHWRPDCHIVNSNWTLNAAGVRYEALIDEWTTNDTATTDISGNANFRGFYGTYTVTLTPEGMKPTTKTIEITPEGTTEFNIELEHMPPLTAQIDVSTRHQTIEGFGAAGAWYENSLVNHPQKNTLYDLLFGELGLDIYRVRNNYDQDGSSGYMSRSGQIVAAAEASLGRPIKVLITSWSPPAYLKSNDSTSRGTLKKNTEGNYMYTEFAQWWAGSIAAWSAYGVDAEYISIQNEPDWQADWDTCLFGGTETNDKAGYNLAFESVWQELNTRIGSAMPKMLAGESAGIPGSYKYLNNLIDLDHVYGHAHHLYNINGGDTPDDYITPMTDFATAFGNKPLFQTEYEKSTEAWPDPLNIATLIHNSLTIEQASAYLYWDLFWGGTKGLINLTSTTYTINPDYYGFKHFSAFIHSGWQRIEASAASSDLRISAYIDPDDQLVTVVIINTNATNPIDTDLSFVAFPIAGGEIYRTTSSENCVHVAAYEPSATLTIPASSVITLALNVETVPFAPKPPTALTSNAADATVSLQWAGNNEADLAGYNIYRSTTSQTGYTKLNNDPLITPEYSDTEVTNFTTYFYVTTAVDTYSNESENSIQTAATPYDVKGTTLASADFENGLNEWKNISGPDTHDWTHNSGETASNNTGPDSGADSSQWYIYLECSANDGGANTAGDTAILQGPQIGGTDRVLTFDYHMFGLETGTLNVDILDTNGIWNNAVWSLSGIQQTSSTQAYSKAYVQLTEYTGLITIRFRAVAAGGIRGDIAIDNIDVTGHTTYGDLNADNIVNTTDLSEFMTYWLTDDCIDWDLNNDCLINLSELAELAKNWQITEE